MLLQLASYIAIQLTLYIRIEVPERKPSVATYHLMSLTYMCIYVYSKDCNTFIVFIIVQNKLYSTTYTVRS